MTGGRCHKLLRRTSKQVWSLAVVYTENPILTLQNHSRDIPREVLSRGRLWRRTPFPYRSGTVWCTASSCVSEHPDRTPRTHICHPRFLSLPPLRRRETIRARQTPGSATWPSSRLDHLWLAQWHAGENPRLKCFSEDVLSFPRVLDPNVGGADIQEGAGKGQRDPYGDGRGPRESSSG